jgi:hypothetical protein
MPDPFAAVIRVNLHGEITNVIMDVDGKKMHGVTSVVEYRLKLYLGSLTNAFVGVIDLGGVPRLEFPGARFWK